jgi:hypothetical protein
MPLAAVVRPVVHDHFGEGAQKRRWIVDFSEESVRRSKGIGESLFDFTETSWEP